MALQVIGTLCGSMVRIGPLYLPACCDTIMKNIFFRTIVIGVSGCLKGWRGTESVLLVNYCHKYQYKSATHHIKDSLYWCYMSGLLQMHVHICIYMLMKATYNIKLTTYIYKDISRASYDRPFWYRHFRFDALLRLKNICCNQF